MSYIFLFALGGLLDIQTGEMAYCFILPLILLLADVLAEMWEIDERE